MKKSLKLQRQNENMERSYNTCLEMLQQRNYIVKEKDERRILATKPDGLPMVVFFADVAKFNVKNIQALITELNKMHVSHAIVVYKDITPFTKKVTSKSQELFELFAEDDLKYNITKHRLQPKFEKLPKKEAEDFKKRYGMKFSTMKVRDPIARFYCYKRGDIIRVIRGEGENQSISYRVVREDLNSCQSSD